MSAIGFGEPERYTNPNRGTANNIDSLKKPLSTIKQSKFCGQ
jgi:hypothetical protein